MRKIGILLLVFSILTACNEKKASNTSDKPTITVSILPQKYFVEKIVGPKFNINVLIPPGASPVTYEPTPVQMKELSNSKLYIRIGHIEFEKAWIKNIKSINPELVVIDQSKNAELIEPEHGHEHSHSHAGHHHHHGVDPHIWISPKEVKKQIGIIYNYLIEEYPEMKPELKVNYNSFLSELDSVDIKIQTELEPYKGKKFLIFHPALSYLARDYGLEQISIEIDGKEPTPSNIQKIVETAKAENIRVVFVQQQFSTHNAEVIANEINGRVVQIDPLSYNWKESIISIVNEIVLSYSNQ